MIDLIDEIIELLTTAYNSKDSDLVSECIRKLSELPYKEVDDTTFKNRTIFIIT